MIPPEARHVIPLPPLETTAAPAPVGEGGGGATYTGVVTIPYVNVGSPEASGAGLLYIAAIVAILFMAVVLLGGASGGRRVAGFSPAAVVGGLRRAWSYFYPGRKRSLRLALEAMYEKALSRGARIARSMTPREAAEEAEASGVRARELVELYYSGVYAPGEPSEEMVRRAWRLARDEG
ncbi:DUF4129 domain-containing protein [Aeropyrum camini]|uniref:Protein-glutamine gamma-glutamyltransferase-like C-terminal domain-containing protein n=1 Tax=Aeropyrum camini SY1 = JCM 12091 TaxID=1198449 RepID=U3TG54_9CREN|nr:DUF4129 domain-containing protein [Aeropyrum camini]BAN90299.1 hypothetical protein ACAM_0830 [Aeropyrum camini SY1 = JCM 12091]